MTAETGTATAAARTWTPRIAAQLVVLAAATFTYVTAELLPVGALPSIAQNLHVSEWWVGTLLASYALVAAVTTFPLVRWTAHWPRRRMLVVSLVCLTISQLISALAPTFVVLALGRIVCAVTHGLLWSVIAPIATRLVPASHHGRATSAIYAGTSLALVLGSPLTALLSLTWGWRAAAVCVTVAAAVVTVAASVLLPKMELTADQLQHVGPRARHHRNRSLIVVSLITMVGVTGHIASYAFILAVISDVVGIQGPKQAWLLAAYGIAAMIAVPLVARPLDSRPRVAILFCIAALTFAFVVLAGLAIGDSHNTVTALLGTGAIVLWGAMATGVSPMLQSVAMRNGRDDPDGASGLYVTAFQVGIAAGSLGGGLLYKQSVALMLGASAGLMGVALIAFAANRHIADGAAPCPAGGPPPNSHQD
jgi:predicted MFS family arabinose efflux permease